MDYEEGFLLDSRTSLILPSFSRRVTLVSKMKPGPYKPNTTNIEHAIANPEWTGVPGPTLYYLKSAEFERVIPGISRLPQGKV